MVNLREIPGFPGYLAGSDGEIYSCRDFSGGISSGTPRKLKPCFAGYNLSYKSYSLRVNNKTKKVNGHALILLAFHGPAEKGNQCSHLNGNSKDNRPCNLQWESPKENNRRKLDHGTNNHGNAHPSAILSVEDVQEIRLLYATRKEQGRSYQDIANLFGINIRHMYDVATGKRRAKCGISRAG